MKRKLIVIFLFLFFRLAYSQEQNFRVEPPFWWAQMNHSKLQLMVHGDGIAKMRAELNFPGVSILKTTPSGNNYLFLDLKVEKETKPCRFKINFSEGGKQKGVVSYELKGRKPASSGRKSISGEDVIYLIMPDRFANGKPANDDHPDMLEKADRKDDNGRHGGDIEGIRQQLDYFQKTGITALWLNPVLENNMPKYSYHGYAITDLYKVDPRFGSNEDYVSLIQEAHRKGIKVIMDMVFNHFGSGHAWMSDLPAPGWIHQWPEFTRTNYRAGVVTDPYASDYDRDRMLNGWFDVTMPDFDQKNPFVANYLIQNSIWWIEYADLDAIRMDTYPYSDKDFMAGWMQRLRAEYPAFKVIGEVWLNTTGQVSHWLDRPSGQRDQRSYLTNEFDFPLMFAIQQAFTEAEGWSNGLTRLYELLSYDFLYADPSQLVTFADNHDIDRMYSMLKSRENVKMAMAFLATLRGIPMFYYGTEALMPGWAGEGHGTIRRDFPGGWPGDTVNFFTGKGLSEDQQDVYSYFSKLLNWRKTSKAVQLGSMKHYIPEDGIYVYFRSLGRESVMVILNNNLTEKTLMTKRFSENLQIYSRGLDVIDNTIITDLGKLNLEPKSVKIIELSK